MNKIALGLSILSLVLASILFYMQFSGPGKAKSSSKEASGRDSMNVDFKMAYFEMDSVENNYEYVKEIREVLRKKEEDNQKQLNNLKMSYQKRIAEWQKKGPNISQAESESYNREYQQMEVNFGRKRDELAEELKSEYQSKLMDVNKKISDYLREYNKSKGYTYIITNESSLIYYKDSVHNITKDLIDGLNAQHKAKKKN